MLRFSRRVLLLAACAATVSLAQSPRPMTLVDVMNVPQVSDPQLAPDGRTVLFVEAEANWKANKRVRHIWKINADGSGLVQMTSGAAGEGSPRWSPDGKSIAFIAKRGDQEANQIFLIALAGGEARPITRHTSAVSDIQWSPDGKSIYFRAPEAKTEQQKAREKAKDDVFLFDENYEQQHIWRVDVADGSEHRITQGDYSVGSFQLSDDGSKIALHRAPTPLLEDSDRSEVWVMDSAGSGAKQITHNHVGESNAMLSPDKSRILFLSQANQNFDIYYNAKLFVAPAAGGEARVLMPDLPYEIERAAWSKDGKAIFFLANMGVHSEIFKAGLDGGKPEQLTNGKHAINAWTFARAADRQIYTVSEMSSPGEVWLAGESASSPRKVTSVFEYLARDFRLPRQERIEWKGEDGDKRGRLALLSARLHRGQALPAGGSNPRRPASLR